MFIDRNWLFRFQVHPTPFDFVSLRFFYCLDYSNGCACYQWYFELKTILSESETLYSSIDIPKHYICISKRLRAKSKLLFLLFHWIIFLSMRIDHISFLNSCSKPEQKINIIAGKLMKEIKNLDDKREEELRKLEEKLNQVSWLVLGLSYSKWFEIQLLTYFLLKGGFSLAQSSYPLWITSLRFDWLICTIFRDSGVELIFKYPQRKNWFCVYAINSFV